MIDDPFQELRERVGAAASIAALHGNMVVDCVDAGDGVGLEHHARQLMIYAKHAATLVGDLQALKHERGLRIEGAK